MDQPHSIKVNTISQISGKLLAVSCGFLSTVLLRRFLGASGFGDYILIINLVTLFVSLSDFGTHLVSVNEYSQAKHTGPKILGNVLILRLILSLLTTMIFVLSVLVFVKQTSLQQLFLFSSLLIPLILFKDNLLIIFHSKQKLYLAALQDLVIAVLLFIATLALSIIGPTLLGYFILAIFCYLITIFVFTPIALTKTEISFEFDKTIIKRLFKKSIPLGLVLALFTIYSKIDTLILKVFTTSAIVGSYGLSYKVYENLTLPAAYFMNSVLPIFARNLKNKKITENNYLQKNSIIFLLISSIVLGAIIFVATPLIVKLITGSFSINEIIVLRILCFALPFAYLNHFTGYTIIAFGKQKMSLIISLLALSINVIANIVFIPRFSLVAASVITVATEVMVLILSLYIIRKEIKIKELIKWKII